MNPEVEVGEDITVLEWFWPATDKPALPYTSPRVLNRTQKTAAASRPQPQTGTASPLREDLDPAGRADPFRPGQAQVQGG